MNENDLILSIGIEVSHASECAPVRGADEICISISIDSALKDNQKRGFGKSNKIMIRAMNELPTGQSETF